MNASAQSPALQDLLTVLYRPRETMRRILDSGHARWTIPIVILAFLNASTNDTDIRTVSSELPDVKLLPLMAIIALGLVAGALLWLLALYVMSWIARPIGRMLGGTGTFADVRAALAWGIVPVIWSVIYRVPLAIYKTRLKVLPNVDVSKTVLDFAAHGGCSFIVIALALQFIFFIWCLVVASCCLAEAQRFSTQKGFINLTISLALPVLVIFAAVFSFTR